MSVDPDAAGTRDGDRRQGAARAAASTGRVAAVMASVLAGAVRGSNAIRGGVAWVPTAGAGGREQHHVGGRP
jgi:hypothetical protein